MQGARCANVSKCVQGGFVRGMARAPFVSVLPRGWVAPCLLSIRHNTSMAWGQALLAGVTDITLTANHQRSAVVPTPAEPALQIDAPPSAPRYPLVPPGTPIQYPVVSYPVTQQSMHLSTVRGKYSRNVLLRLNRY